MAVEVGQVAPDFELKDQHGTPVKLSGLRGKKVVLVFYPLAFTPVCHGELTAIRDGLVGALPDDARVLTVSVDSMFSHRAWAEQEGFTFPLLSDFWPHGAVARAYGVFNEERGIANRGTFLIDKQGIVRFAEMNPPGQARDQDGWRRAIAALGND